MNDYVAQGAGENLKDLTPEELRAAINRYLDKGPDFIKYGGTSHFSEPTFIGFSPEAQKVMVEEAHKRGRAAETHSTSIEGLRLSIEAGIDLIQHPEVMTPREMPDDLIRAIKDRGITGSMLVSTITGEAWTKHVKARDEAQKKLDEALKKGLRHELTGAEGRKRDADLGADLEMRRRNAQKLIRAGIRITPGTDSYWGAAPDLAREPKPETQDHGMGTILAIEGLVELGMTPAQAIVAAHEERGHGVPQAGSVRHARNRQTGGPGGAGCRPAGGHSQHPQSALRDEGRPRRRSEQAAGRPRPVGRAAGLPITHHGFRKR